MPRLPPYLLRRAKAISPHLATLLPACRDLSSARNELRWIREYVDKIAPLRPYSPGTKLISLTNAERQEDLLGEICGKRGHGVPLQYLLGTQPFGDLEIKCRPGVLIPRPETEAWVVKLAEVVGGYERKDGEKGLRVLDLCTGSGCIALLLNSLLRRRFPKLSIRGVDIEPKAIALARENLADATGLASLPKSEHNVTFEKADIFSKEWLESLDEVDILISNPPYISTKGFNHDTGRSVCRYEPKLALVPDPSADQVLSMKCQPEDVFYARILDIAKTLRPRVTVLEVGDLAQGLRVVKMAQIQWSDAEIEVWRDWPDMEPQDDEQQSIEVDGVKVLVRGSGHGRTVFIRHLA
ncbi:S-adenosyl-L-methionine-dependent methyltransferase [Annulohypoxylon nitens]|nr:S-adenosyl-L-methionine-dependent methyltransferase [Annulohypoxylon nitens]